LRPVADIDATSEKLVSPTVIPAYLSQLITFKVKKYVAGFDFWLLKAISLAHTDFLRVMRPYLYILIQL
jgi:hypothetical protein